MIENWIAWCVGYAVLMAGVIWLAKRAHKPPVVTEMLDEGCDYWCEREDNHDELVGYCNKSKRECLCQCEKRDCECGLYDDMIVNEKRQTALRRSEG